MHNSNNLKKVAISGIIAATMLSSTLAISALAQGNSQDSPRQSATACEKVKNNLISNFDSALEKKEAVPFKLETVLSNKVATLKSKGKSTAKLEEAVAQIKLKVDTSQAAFSGLFEIMDKIKTTDCNDAQSFGRLIQQARAASRDAKSSVLPIMTDLKAKVKPELDALDQTQTPEQGSNPSAAINVEEVSSTTRASSKAALSGRIIVKFKDQTPANKIKEIVDNEGIESDHIKNPNLKLPNEVIIKAKNPNQVEGLLNALANNPNVEYAQYDNVQDFVEPESKAVSPALTTTNDLYTQWHIENINASADLPSSGQGVLVAVCDTGVQRDHPDLSANVRADLGFNIYTGTAAGWDVLENPHGTMVSGTIASIANNGIGGRGVAFGAKIIPLKVSFDSTGSTYTSYLSSCIKYAADNGAKVVNVSFGGAGDASIANAARYANSKGATVFFAAGNSGTQLRFKNYPEIIVSSATNEANTLASFSDFGSFVDISAPGTNIITTTFNGGYASVNGTSFSSPISAGVAALMLQLKPNLTPTQVLSALKSSSTDLGKRGYDVQFGAGKVDAAKAVTTAQSL